MTDRRTRREWAKLAAREQHKREEGVMTQAEYKQLLEQEDQDAEACNRSCRRGWWWVFWLIQLISLYWDLREHYVVKTPGHVLFGSTLVSLFEWAFAFAFCWAFTYTRCPAVYHDNTCHIHDLSYSIARDVMYYSTDGEWPPRTAEQMTAWHRYLFEQEEDWYVDCFHGINRFRRWVAIIVVAVYALVCCQYGICDSDKHLNITLPTGIAALWICMLVTRHQTTLLRQLDEFRISLDKL